MFKINEAIFLDWLRLKKHGDISKISKSYNLPIDKVRIALCAGVCDENNFAVIQKFYEARKSERDRILADAAPY